MKSDISNDSSGRSPHINMARAVITAFLLGKLFYTLVGYLIQLPDHWADSFIHHLKQTPSGVVHAKKNNFGCD
jgi:hypothetical protein